MPFTVSGAQASVSSYPTGVSMGPPGSAPQAQPASTEAMTAALTQHIDMLQHHVSNLKLACQQAGVPDAAAASSSGGWVMGGPSHMECRLRSSVYWCLWRATMGMWPKGMSCAVL